MLLLVALAPLLLSSGVKYAHPGVDGSLQLRRTKLSRGGFSRLRWEGGISHLCSRAGGLLLDVGGTLWGIGEDIQKSIVDWSVVWIIEGSVPWSVEVPCVGIGLRGFIDQLVFEIVARLALDLLANLLLYLLPITVNPVPRSGSLSGDSPRSPQLAASWEPSSAPLRRCGWRPDH